jgi:predicted nucleic acid-binding protein
LKRRDVPLAPALALLGLVTTLVQIVEVEAYSRFESAARERIGRRDEDDWPILALGLALDCPIWPEDTDFFGCGVATWTTDRVELYLSEIRVDSGRD